MKYIYDEGKSIHEIDSDLSIEISHLKLFEEKTISITNNKNCFNI